MLALRGAGHFLCLWFVFAVAIIGAASAQQGGQPQFKSGGLQVSVNRAVLNSAGGLVMSLILTNPGDDGVEIFLVSPPTAIADIGGMARAERVSGLPICNPIALHNIGFPGCATEWRPAIAPTMIDGHNSITVTLYFETSSNSKICSVDFSMPSGIRRTGGRSQDPWRQIVIGLPNVKVC